MHTRTRNEEGAARTRAHSHERIQHTCAFAHTNAHNTQAMEAVRVQAAAALNAFLNETAVMPSTTVSLNNVAEGLVSSGFIMQVGRVHE